MRDGVDDGVVAARRLGNNDRDGRDQRSDFADIAPCAQHADDGERSPCNGPQRNVDDGHFGNTDLSRSALLIGVATQRSDVHFLGLLTKFIFVFEDSPDDSGVSPNDDGQRDQVVKDAQQQDGILVGVRLCDVIVRAAG